MNEITGISSAFIVLRSQMNDYTVTDAKAGKRKNAGNDQSYFHGRPY